MFVFIILNYIHVIYYKIILINQVIQLNKIKYSFLLFLNFLQEKDYIIINLLIV